VVTGKVTSYAGEFLAKKIEEYGNEANLTKFYVCKEVKALLKKGYKVKDIKKILDVLQMQMIYQKTLLKR